jgi:hypothetical protein
MGAAQSSITLPAQSIITQAALFILMGAATSLTTVGQQSTTMRAARLALQLGELVELEHYRALAPPIIVEQLTQIAPRRRLKFHTEKLIIIYLHKE